MYSISKGIKTKKQGYNSLTKGHRMSKKQSRIRKKTKTKKRKFGNKKKKLGTKKIKFLKSTKNNYVMKGGGKETPKLDAPCGNFQRVGFINRNTCKKCGFQKSEHGAGGVGAKMTVENDMFATDDNEAPTAFTGKGRPLQGKEGFDNWDRKQQGSVSNVGPSLSLTQTVAESSTPTKVRPTLEEGEDNLNTVAESPTPTKVRPTLEEGEDNSSTVAAYTKYEREQNVFDTKYEREQNVFETTIKCLPFKEQVSFTKKPVLVTENVIPKSTVQLMILLASNIKVVGEGKPPVYPDKSLYPDKSDEEFINEIALNPIWCNLNDKHIDYFMNDHSLFSSTSESTSCGYALTGNDKYKELKTIQQVIESGILDLVHSLKDMSIPTETSICKFRFRTKSNNQQVNKTVSTTDIWVSVWNNDGVFRVLSIEKINKSNLNRVPLATKKGLISTKELNIKTILKSTKELNLQTLTPNDLKKIKMEWDNLSGQVSLTHLPLKVSNNIVVY